MIENSDDFCIGAADIGNSRLKILAGDEYAAFDYKTNWIAKVDRFLNRIGGRKLRLGYSSVKPSAVNLLENILSTIRNIELIDIAVYLQKQQVLSYSNISGIGTDRLLGLIGAMSYSPPPLITVDCGTAVTINAVGEKGDCRGGAILAGAYTQLESLKFNTEGLPEVQFDRVENPAGKNTIDAMRSGVIFGIAGAIDLITEKIILSEFGGLNLPVYITGGYAGMILDAFGESNKQIIHKQNLVLDGIIYLLGNVKFEN